MKPPIALSLLGMLACAPAAQAADVLVQQDRGRIAPGTIADLVLRRANATHSSR